MLTVFARFISYLFHPVFVILYGLLIFMVVNPYLFPVQDPKAAFLLVFSVGVMTVVFPLFSTFMMKMLDLIKSFKLEDNTERIGPLIVTGTFYLWLFINIKDNSTVPTMFSFFVLGATIALFLSLLLNSFTKISLHTVAAGGIMMATILVKYHFSYDNFFIDLGFGTLNVHTRLLPMVAIVVGGLIGTSRLVLKAHTPFEVFGGYLVGIFAQFIAFRIMV